MHSHGAPPPNAPPPAGQCALAVRLHPYAMRAACPLVPSACSPWPGWHGLASTRARTSAAEAVRMPQRPQPDDSASDCNASSSLLGAHHGRRCRASPTAEGVWMAAARCSPAGAALRARRFASHVAEAL
eukprot:scaffold265865_cov24-Tisochrysis_lutea.AAC.1